MINLRQRLLWIDGSGGLLVGLVVLALLNWLTVLHGLPKGVLAASGVANVAYGCYSLSLARRAVRPPALIRLLVVANLAWAVVCFALATRYSGSASFLGLGHLLMEGVYVGALGCLEWHWREHLYVQERSRLAAPGEDS